MTLAACALTLTPLRVNEWATKILPSSVLRISSATYLTVESLYFRREPPKDTNSPFDERGSLSPRGVLINGPLRGSLAGFLALLATFSLSRA